MTLQPKPEQCINEDCGKVFTWADEMANSNLGKGATTKGMCRQCRKKAWIANKQFEKKID